MTTVLKPACRVISKMATREKRHWAAARAECSQLNMACNVRFMSFNTEFTLNSSPCCALSARQSQPFFFLL